MVESESEPKMREEFLRQAQDKFRGKPAAQRGSREKRDPTRSEAKGHAQIPY